MKHWVESVSDEDLHKLTAAQLTAARNELIESVEEVAQQLGSRKGGGDAINQETGLPMTRKEYHEWRRSATFASTAKRAALRRVKAALSQKNRNDFDSHIMGSVVPAARALVRELRRYKWGHDPAVDRCLRKLEQVVALNTMEGGK